MPVPRAPELVPAAVEVDAPVPPPVPINPCTLRPAPGAPPEPEPPAPEPPDPDPDLPEPGVREPDPPEPPEPGTPAPLGEVDVPAELGTVFVGSEADEGVDVLEVFEFDAAACVFDSPDALGAVSACSGLCAPWAALPLGAFDPDDPEEPPAAPPPPADAPGFSTFGTGISTDCVGPTGTCSTGILESRSPNGFT
ncbi:hypothetical protein [Nocardia bovistercoris]|uniref:hypothetical protein n=1 Tax=Nocardia bovistercoris TaxID=2785916 RepID=UPI001E2B8ECE|nr:hypothetical protein [Nocardia bovistercoris]